MKHALSAIPLLSVGYYTGFKAKDGIHNDAKAGIHNDAKLAG